VVVVEALDLKAQPIERCVDPERIWSIPREPVGNFGFIQHLQDVENPDVFHIQNSSVRHRAK